MKVPKSVLIVENEIIIADDVSRVLCELGFDRTHIAFDFNQAIELFEIHSPDLVILDIRLNGRKSGIDLAQWILEQSTVPVIYMTALTDSNTRTRADQTAPIDFIFKPFQDFELKNSVQKAFLV